MFFFSFSFLPLLLLSLSSSSSVLGVLGLSSLTPSFTTTPAISEPIPCGLQQPQLQIRNQACTCNFSSKITIAITTANTQAIAQATLSPQALNQAIIHDNLPHPENTHSQPP
jgi:hypothetical protein